MATIGTQPTFNGADYFGVNTQPYQIGQYVGAFGGGVITQVNVYVGGWNNSVTVQLCIWDSAGNLLWNSGNIVAPQASSLTANGQGWVTWNGAVNLGSYPGGIIIGCWRDPSGRFVFSRDGNGTYDRGNNTGVGNLLTYGTGVGTLGAYAVYSTGGVKTYSGGVATKHPPKSYDGSAWHQHPVREWNGSAWQHVA